MMFRKKEIQEVCEALDVMVRKLNLHALSVNVPAQDVFLGTESCLAFENFGKGYDRLSRGRRDIPEYRIEVMQQIL
jgi:hypothetical protein